jgi:hypothetical protein
MAEAATSEFVEDQVPFEGMEEAIEELVEIYGGEVTVSRQNAREFSLPLRRGVAASGAIACTISWAPDNASEATVKLVCDREVDAPKYQRILMLVVGVVGSLLFLMWPFFPQRREWGALAWIGGAVALAVYFLSLRRTAGGIAYDFLQRLVSRQRAATDGR